MSTSGPSRSAMLVAACRALAEECAPSQRLISDPFARSFVDDRALEAARLDPPLQRVLRLRTRYIDDRVVSFCASHPNAEVLLLGAGLDARPFRLDVEARFIEMDMPASVDGKQQILDSLGVVARDRRAVGVDLTVDRVPPALSALGFDRSSPAFVVWEGVVFYLSETAAVRVINDLASVLAPGSELVFDYSARPAQSDFDARANTDRIAASLSAGGEPLRNGLSDALGTLDAAGFDVLDDGAVEELGPRYGLDPFARVYPARILHARRR
jgi:methyltransferase (TIGR00027 family)